MNVPEDKPSRGEQEDGNVLTRNHRQEGICKSYITAVASRCGMGWSVPHPDYGIDLTLNDIESYDDSLAESGYKLDVQGKSATRTQLTVTHVKYDLERRAYDLLRQPRVIVDCTNGAGVDASPLCLLDVAERASAKCESAICSS
jgi:hypothetical protein